jgi:hypothetical protein
MQKDAEGKRSRHGSWPNLLNLPGIIGVGTGLAAFSAGLVLAAIGERSEGFQLSGFGVLVINIGLWRAVRRSEMRPPILQVASSAQALGIALGAAAFVAFFLSVATMLLFGPGRFSVAPATASIFAAIAASWIALLAFRRFRQIR